MACHHDIIRDRLPTTGTTLKEGGPSTTSPVWQMPDEHEQGGETVIDSPR